MTCNLVQEYQNTRSHITKYRNSSNVNSWYSQTSNNEPYDSQKCYSLNQLACLWVCVCVCVCVCVTGRKRARQDCKSAFRQEVKMNICNCQSVNRK
jgi:hypothetical protein